MVVAQGTQTRTTIRPEALPAPPDVETTRPGRRRTAHRATQAAPGCAARLHLRAPQPLGHQSRDQLQRLLETDTRAAGRARRRMGPAPRRQPRQHPRATAGRPRGPRRHRRTARPDRMRRNPGAKMKAPAVTGLEDPLCHQLGGPLIGDPHHDADVAQRQPGLVQRPGGGPRRFRGRALRPRASTS